MFIQNPSAYAFLIVFNYKTKCFPWVPCLIYCTNWVILTEWWLFNSAFHLQPLLHRLPCFIYTKCHLILSLNIELKASLLASTVLRKDINIYISCVKRVTVLLYTWKTKVEVWYSAWALDVWLKKKNGIPVHLMFDINLSVTDNWCSCL